MGAYIRNGNLMEGFLRYRFGGLIFGGAYFRNFRVAHLLRPYRLCLCLVSQATIMLQLYSLDERPQPNFAAKRNQATALTNFKQSRGKEAITNDGNTVMKHTFQISLSLSVELKGIILKL